MSGQRKVYVIDPVNPKAKVDISVPVAGEGRGTGGDPGASRNTGSKDGKASASKANDRESGVSLLLSYMVGPLSILATRRGRKGRPWVAIAFVSVILSVAAIVMWRRDRFWSSHEGPAGAILMIAAIVAVISGCLAWSRAVILNGRHEGPRLRRSPGWMRGPLAAGIFGTVCPGMGLYAAGRSRQAAAALWMAGITAISFILISKSGWLWDFNAHAGAFAINPDALEYVLAGASMLAALGAVAWVVQALNGMRLAAPAKDRRADAGRNWAALALLASFAAFSIFFRPAMIAEALDSGASIAESRGMKIIPLHLTLGAARLDPSRPEYTVRAIGLYEATGDRASAELLRSSLIDRLEKSLPLLEEEGVIASRNSRDYGSGTDPASLDAWTPGPASAYGPAIPTIPAELLTLDWGISGAKP